MAAKLPFWVGDRALQMPTILQHWDGLPTVTLSKIASGARLLWIFHEEFPEQFGVFVHLTDYEAQRVFETPDDSGLLESTRPILRDRDAFVYRKYREQFGSSPFRIPKRGSEPDFAEKLWEAAEAVPPMMDLDKYRMSKRRGVSEVEQVADTRFLTLEALVSAKA